MDYESDHYKISKVGSSVLQPEKELFIPSKLLTRQSTAGSCSSRFFYGASEGVPFQWETKPGKPITAPPDNILPPLSPPPAVLSMGLPKPYMDLDDDHDEPKAKKWSRAWLVMKFKKISIMDRPNKLLGRPIKIFYQDKQQRQQQQQQQQHFGSQRYDHSESFRSSSSSVASSTLTSSSSNSFSENRTSSSSKVINNNNAQSKAVMQGRPFTCNPRGLSDIVVYFVKK